MTDAGAMSPAHPYILRAIHEWIVDNGCTPYLLVDAEQPGVQVPAQAVRDGRVVLNLAPEAVARLELGNEDIVFHARFSGVSMRVVVPIGAVRALYARETGQGLAFPAGAAAGDDGLPGAWPGGPVQAAEDGIADDPPDDPDAGPPAPRAPHLRVVK